MASPDDLLTIGAVLASLRPDFPDVTISKIRFLEAEGLLEPQRSPGGYRKFRPADVERLRYVLSAQRDRYLPLRVIKEHLAALDEGRELAPPGATGSSGTRATAAEEPAAAETPGPPARSDTQPDTQPDTKPDPGPPLDPRPPPVQRRTRGELIEAAGIDEKMLRQLESFALLAARPGGYYDDDALQVAATARRMGAYGVEPRHLRFVKAAADRELGLIEQVVTPLRRRRSPDARGRADEVARELAALSVQLHAALVRAGLRR